MPTYSSNIFSIPPELLEEVLIFCAVFESPESIAAVAQTCRFFRALIYDTQDSHLWREIFLSTFDDPRRIFDILHLPFSDDLARPSFDWQTEFIRRSSAKQFINRYRAQPQGSDVHESPPQIMAQSLDVLRTIDSIIRTAKPFPKYPKALEFFLNPPPTFPPLVLILSTPMQHSLLPTLKSKNAIWLNCLLQNGYPRVLTKRLIGTHLPPSSPGLRQSRRRAKQQQALTELEGDDRAFARVLDKNWDTTDEGRTFYRLVFLTGFIPSISLTEKGPHKYNLRSSINSSIGIPLETQIQMARGVARSVVYSIPYLSADRCWGPFRNLAATKTPQVQEIPKDGDDGAQEEPALTQGRVRQFEILLNGVLLNAYGELNSDDDEDYQPPPTASSSRAQYGSDDGDAEDGSTDDNNSSDDDDDDGLPSFPANLLLLANEEDEVTHPTYIFPKYPHQLVPDYTFLASARLVIEENLRSRLLDVSAEWASTVTVINEDAQVIQREITSENPTKRLMEALRSLENLRMGSATGFWNSAPWQKAEPEANTEGPSDDDKEREGQPENQKEGYWDWAGAEGQWRRCVCWMDYRDLLFHNLRAFRDGGSDIRETLRIFPMKLRVVRYEDPPSPPPSNTKGKGKATDSCEDHVLDGAEDPATSLVYRLPIIHVEGEAFGSDMDEQAVRKLKGTVRVIGDGNVRWSLTSSEPDGSDPEWVTECVQVGNIGSAIGFVGLWTGAGHARSDPLGPTLAWRIA